MMPRRWPPGLGADLMDRVLQQRVSAFVKVASTDDADVRRLDAPITERTLITFARQRHVAWVCAFAREGMVRLLPGSPRMRCTASFSVNRQCFRH